MLCVFFVCFFSTFLLTSEGIMHEYWWKKSVLFRWLVSISTFWCRAKYTYTLYNVGLGWMVLRVMIGLSRGMHSTERHCSWICFYLCLFTSGCAASFHKTDPRWRKTIFNCEVSICLCTFESETSIWHAFCFKAATWRCRRNDCSQQRAQWQD